MICFCFRLRLLSKNSIAPAQAIAKLTTEKSINEPCRIAHGVCAIEMGFEAGVATVADRTAIADIIQTITELNHTWRITELKNRKVKPNTSVMITIDSNSPVIGIALIEIALITSIDNSNNKPIATIV